MFENQPSAYFPHQVYYYMVQKYAPFTVGCFGYPGVTMKECRGLYTGCSTSASKTVTSDYGSGKYELDCPCFGKRRLHLLRVVREV